MSLEKHFEEQLESRPEGIPEHLWGGIVRWVRRGLRPGRFLKAVLENDLEQAVNYGDDEALGALRPIVSFVAWKTPSSCRGSATKVARWMRDGGLEGRGLESTGSEEQGRGA
jgi:hypothetical protein